MCIAQGRAAGRSLAAYAIYALSAAAAAEAAAHIGGPSLFQSGIRLGMLRPHAQTNSAVPSASSSAAKHGPISLILELDTSEAEGAETADGARVSFNVGGEWVSETISRMSRGELVFLHVRLRRWPAQVKIEASGPDSWGYDRIKLHWGDFAVTVLDLGDGPSSRHWVDGNESAVTSNIYNVTKVEHTGAGQVASTSEGALTNESSANCTTRDDPRANTFGYTTSPEGTACVFGVDPRDEGSHCILDDERYGSLGWCFTSESGGSWGSCGEQCPLFGADRLLGKKIDELRAGTP